MLIPVPLTQIISNVYYMKIWETLVPKGQHFGMNAEVVWHLIVTIMILREHIRTQNLS